MITLIAMAHAIFVHFPIALFTVAALVETLRYFKLLNVSAQVTVVCLVVGASMATIAVPLGLFAATIYGATSLVIAHAVCGITTALGSYLVLYRYLTQTNMFAKFIGPVILATLVGLTGFLGGELMRGLFLY